MTGIRNGVLARNITVAAGFTLIKTVPANMTWLLKSVHLYNSGSVQTSAVVRFAAPNGVYAWLPPVELEPSGHDLWQGWTTLMPGDQLQLYGNQGGIHIWANGAELPGTI